MIENTNKPISVKLSRRTVSFAKLMKEKFKLHSIEETMWLSLKLMDYLRIKDRIGKGELWSIAGYSTKEFEVNVHVQGDVAKPTEIQPLRIKSTDMFSAKLEKELDKNG